MTELQKIKYVPNFQAMTISTKALEKALNETFRSFNGYGGSRVRVANSQLKVEISMFRNSTCIEKNHVAKLIKAENAVQLASDFAKALEGTFVDPDYEIEMREIKDRYVITLDPYMTLLNMIEAREGKIYQTQLADLGKEGSITIYEFDEHVSKQVKNIRPQGTNSYEDRGDNRNRHNYNNNNQGGNNNRNQGGNQGYHNNKGNRGGNNPGKKFDNGGRPPQQQGGHRKY